MNKRLGMPKWMWMFWRREKCLALARIETQGCPAHRLVIVLTILPLLLNNFNVKLK
jgi:hypothetical protein